MRAVTYGRARSFVCFFLSFSRRTKQMHRHVRDGTSENKRWRETQAKVGPLELVNRDSGKGWSS